VSAASTGLADFFRLTENAGHETARREIAGQKKDIA